MRNDDGDDCHHPNHSPVEEADGHLSAGGGEPAIEMGLERMRFTDNHSTMGIGVPVMRRLISKGTSSGWVHHAVRWNTERSR
jgi:hypothetical protein